MSLLDTCESHGLPSPQGMRTSVGLKTQWRRTVQNLDLRMREARMEVDPIPATLQTATKLVTAMAEFYLGKLTSNARFDSDRPASIGPITNLEPA